MLPDIENVRLACPRDSSHRLPPMGDIWLQDKKMDDIETPRFPIFSLPKEEQDAAFVLNGNFSILTSSVSDFSAALQLFDLSTRKVEILSDPSDPHRSVYRAWRFMAARDGAMTIYHMMKVIDGIKALLRFAPTIRNRVDRIKMRTATRLLDSYFRDFNKIRNVVAHLSELSQTLEAFQKNAFSGSALQYSLNINNIKNFMIQNSLSDRKYIITINGEILSYEISGVTLSKIREAVVMFCAAFKDAAAG